jgi:hypothetical protein
MFCEFCKRDVESACHTAQEVLQWAEHHIEPCELALAHVGGEPSEQRVDERGA